MLNLSYSVKGADQVAQDLGRFRLDSIQAEVAAILDDMAKEAAHYPPELPGQRYVRTGTLGRGWTGGQTMFPQKSATELEALRENSTPYGPNVQGAQDQAKIHQGRWKTTEALMADWEARVAQRVEQAIVKVLPR